MNQSEEQLEVLRLRLKEIRTAKKWLQEFKLHNSFPTVFNSNGLARYLNWLNDQETKTVELGKRIKSQINLPK